MQVGRGVARRELACGAGGLSTLDAFFWQWTKDVRAAAFDGPSARQALGAARRAARLPFFDDARRCELHWHAPLSRRPTTISARCTVEEMCVCMLYDFRCSDISRPQISLGRYLR